MIDVNKWIDKNGSFDEAGGLDLVRHGYEWIRRMRKKEKFIVRKHITEHVKMCINSMT